MPSVPLADQPSRPASLSLAQRGSGGPGQVQRLVRRPAGFHLPASLRLWASTSCQNCSCGMPPVSSIWRRDLSRSFLELGGVCQQQAFQFVVVRDRK